MLEEQKMRMWQEYMGMTWGLHHPKNYQTWFLSPSKSIFHVGMLDALPEPGLLGGSSQTGSGL